MSYDFNADEILQMAEQIERNGATFYRSSAAGVSDPASKELLLNLADMEDNHEQTFAAIREALTDKERESTTFDPENEAMLYLKALADSRVFNDTQVPNIESMTDRSEKEIMEEILRFAIGAEKESIIFYLGMNDAVPENLGRGRLDGIIKEEMRHIRLLSNKLVSLKRR